MSKMKRAFRKRVWTAMQGNRSQEIFGIFLAVLGVLFLLVNNNLLWFGWQELWPTLVFLIGLFLVRVYTRRNKPQQLFVGLLLLQFGAFFFLFTTGILSWEKMDVLWPTLPLMLGISLLALSLAGEHTAPAVVFGLVVIIFATVAYLGETDVISPRLSGPFVRVWPLVLVLAGILIYLRAKRERLEAAGFAATAGPEAGEEDSKLP